VIRQPLPIGIRLNNPNDSIQVGDTETYTAYLNYDDGTSEVLATGVTLTTSNGVVASVVTVGRGGFGGLLQVVGQAAGTVTVTASYTTNGQTYTIRRNSPSRRSPLLRRSASASRHLRHR